MKSVTAVTRKPPRSTKPWWILKNVLVYIQSLALVNQNNNDLIYSCREQAPPRLFFIRRMLNRVSIVNWVFQLTYFCTPAAAQSVDTLLSVSSPVIQPADVTGLYLQAEKFVDLDNRLAKQFIDEAMVLAKAGGDRDEVIKIGILKAKIFRRLNQIDSAVNLYYELVPIAIDVNLGTIFNGLGLAFLQKAEYDKALDYNFRALEIIQKNGDKSLESIVLANIGLVHYKLSDYKTAITYYTKSFELKTKIHNDADLDLILVNISLCYAYCREFSKARDFVDRGVIKCRSNCSNEFLMQANFCKGIIAFGESKIAQAETYFKKSFAISKSMSNGRFELDNIIYLTDIYVTRGEVDKAKSLLGEAELLANAGSPYKLELIKIYREFFELYERLGNFERTAFFQRKYILLKDSVYNAELTTNLMRLEANFTDREYKIKLDAQGKILELNSDMISRQRYFNILMAAFVVLLSFLAIILIRNNRLKKFANKLLEQRVTERTRELESSTTSLQRSIEGKDNKMERISGSIKNTLATIKGLCILGQTDPEPQMTRVYMERIEQTSDQLLNIVERFTDS